MRNGIHMFALLLAGACASAQNQPPLPTAIPALTPFSVDYRAGMAGHSPVDVSFLLDAPAGHHGFIHAAGGHLVDGSGQRIRLWGVNITEWSRGSTMIPSKQDAPLWASTLARYGVNC